MPPTNITALSIPFYELESLLKPFRQRHIHTPAVHVPPHVTLHVPFKPYHTITKTTLTELTDLFSQTASFSCSLQKLGRFPAAGVLYLSPEPAAPFLTLSYQLQQTYPEAPLEFAEPVMHLTIAQGGSDINLDHLEAQFLQEYAHRLPLQVKATAVCLHVKRDETWVKENTFPLGK